VSAFSNTRSVLQTAFEKAVWSPLFPLNLREHLQTPQVFFWKNCRLTF